MADITVTPNVADVIVDSPTSPDVEIVTGIVDIEVAPDAPSGPDITITPNLTDISLVTPVTPSFEVSTTSVNIEIASGSSGSVGPEGPQGPQGIQGPIGNTGPAGADGDDGAAGPGVPVGGGAGQVLAKDSGVDYDTEWINPPAPAEGIPAGGTTGQVLAKDSVTDYDVEWIDPAAGTGGVVEMILPMGTSAHPGIAYIPGRYYDGAIHAGPINTNAATGALIFNPLFTGAQNITLDRIGIYVSTASTSGNMRVGIYTAHPDTGAPQTLLLDAGTFSTATTGAKEITISQALEGNTLYWLGYVASENCTMYGHSGGNAPNVWGYPSLVNSDNLYYRVLYSMSYAALPSTVSGLAYSGGEYGSVRVRVASATTMAETGVAVVSYSQNLSAGTTAVITHNLGTLDVIVGVYRLSDGADVDVPLTRTDTNTVTLSSAVSLASHRVVIIAAAGG